MELAFKIVQSDVLMFLLLVALVKFDTAPFQCFMLNHEVFCLRSNVLIYISPIVTHLHI